MYYQENLYTWPFQLPFGAEDQDPPNPPKDEGAEENPPADEDEKKKDDKKPSEKKDDKDEDDNDPLSKLTPKELRRIIADSEKSRKDIERERDTYKKTVDEVERATRSKEENLQSDLDKANARISALLATNAKVAIINAILAEKKWAWHNPEIVAAQLDPKVVKVSDDGKVDGLVKELARIAKEHEYLLMQGNSGGQGPTGFQPGQGGSNSKTTKQELAKDYPALLGRM